MIARTGLVSLALALVLLPSGVPAAVLPLLRDEWQSSALAAGWVVGAYQAGYLLSAVLVLPLTDRFAAGRVITVGALVAALAALLFPVLAHDVAGAGLLRILAGLGLAGVYLPGVRLVAFLARPSSRGLLVAAYVSAFYLGSALSLWATGLLLAPLGWRGAAAALGCLALLAPVAAAIASRNLAPPTGGRGQLTLAVLRQAPVRRVIAAYTGHSWELYVARGWLAAYLASVLLAGGFGSTDAVGQGSQWAALMAGMGTPGVWLGGWLSDRYGRARSALAIAVASGLLSLGFGLLLGAPWPLLVAYGCVHGLLLGADSSIYSTAITELAPRGQLGSAQALQAVIGFSATLLAPLAAGAALDAGLGWAGVFALAGGVGLLLALPLWRDARRA